MDIIRRGIIYWFIDHNVLTFMYFEFNCCIKFFLLLLYSLRRLIPTLLSYIGWFQVLENVRKWVSSVLIEFNLIINYFKRKVYYRLFFQQTETILRLLVMKHCSLNYFLDNV